MSRNTKIKDTKRVIVGFDENECNYFANLGTEGCIPLSREFIKYYSDEGCLEACELLYDLNIQTINSGANVDGNENTESNAFIGISYDTLSDENKKIVSELIKKGIIDGIREPDLRNDKSMFSISVPIKSDDLVGDVSDKLMMIASYFVQQDVLYGRTTLEEIKSMYYQTENGNFFDIWTQAEITKDELAERLSWELDRYYDDGQGNLFATEDLLRKHLLFQNQKDSSLKK